MSVDHMLASPVYVVNKAVDKDDWNRDPYHLNGFSLDFSHTCSNRFKSGLRAGHCMILMLFCWTMSLVVLKETAKIVHTLKSKDLIHVPQSRDEITSIWNNILKDSRSSFFTDPHDSPNHNALLTP